jgi:hypothetical protein
MSNKQARATNRVILKAITVTLENGTELNLDIHRVDLIDKSTKKRLFKLESK